MSDVTWMKWDPQEPQSILWLTPHGRVWVPCESLKKESPELVGLNLSLRMSE